MANRTIGDFYAAVDGLEANQVALKASIDALLASINAIKDTSGISKISNTVSVSISDTYGENALPTTEAKVNAFKPRQVSASLLTRLDTAPLIGRRYLDVVLVGAGTGYIGNSDLAGDSNGIPVTSTEGYRVFAGSEMPIYGVGGTFLIVEVA